MERIELENLLNVGVHLKGLHSEHQHVGESSSEDEFMALNHAYKAMKWLRSLMTEMGLGHLVDDPSILLNKALNP